MGPKQAKVLIWLSPPYTPPSRAGAPNKGRGGAQGMVLGCRGHRVWPRPPLKTLRGGVAGQQGRLVQHWLAMARHCHSEGRTGH